MQQDSRKGYKIYHSLLGMILTLALIFWINEHFVLKVHVLICVLYSLVPAVLLFLLDKYKKNTISYLVLLGLLVVGVLILLISSTNPIKVVTDIVDWVIKYNRTDDMYEVFPVHMVLAVVSILGSILFFFIIRKLLYRILLGAVIVLLFVILSVAHIHMSKIVVGICIFYILNILIELSGLLYSKRTGIKDKKESVFYLIPVCILLAFIAAGLPSKSEPIQWTGVKNIYFNIKDRIEKLMTQWEFFMSDGAGIFSISLSGYSEEGSLDNKDLVNSQKVALKITGRRGLSPIYLTGSVNDTYTGYSWEKSKEDYLPDEQEYQMDYAELLYGLSRLDPQVFNDNRFAETKSIKVIYNNIKTKTFFYPSKIKWFQFDNHAYYLDMEYAGMTFQKPKGEKTAYNLSFFELNLQGPEFQNMLRMADDFSYNVNREIDRERISFMEDEMFVRDKENFVLNREDFYELFRERAKVIYDCYTYLPPDLPERVKDLAIEITKNHDTRYDKLKALEEYLLEFEYSYEPGRVPEGRDFVDYFLFDNKKGYCTSFATALAVLGRCIGIPTRYVEGYVVNYGDMDDIGFLVRNSNAHAWTEAYFDGVGWIPFEATPSMHEERYTMWAPKRKYEDNGRSSSYNRMEIAPPIYEVPDIDYEKSYRNDKKDDLLLLVLIFLATIIIVLTIIISYYLILRRKYHKEFERYDNNNKMYLLFLRILFLLRYNGFVLGAQDTLLSLAERIKDRYQYNDIVFTDVVNVFMAYRYGDIPVTDMQLDRVDTFYRGLMTEHENETKKLKLHIEEFLFLVRRYSHSANY